MTDAEKQAWCLKNTGFGVAILSPSAYAAAERNGMDMRHYVIWKSTPALPVAITDEEKHATWLMADPVTDEEKHAWCQKRGYPHALFLPASLYAQAERNGGDMRWYVIQKPMPHMTKAEENAIYRASNEQ